MACGAAEVEGLQNQASKKKKLSVGAPHFFVYVRVRSPPESAAAAVAAAAVVGRPVRVCVVVVVYEASL